jgi:prepilin-type N-terminal cleavage/methylation domain-containing protein
MPAQLLGHPGVLPIVIIHSMTRQISSRFALVRVARKSETRFEMKIRSRKNSAFTLVEIMIVVAIIGLLASIAIPNFVRSRSTAQAIACVNNLRQIDGAKEQWALETKAAVSATPSSTDLAVYVKGGLPVCPVGSVAYTINDLNTRPACGNAAALTNHVLP